MNYASNMLLKFSSSIHKYHFLIIFVFGHRRDHTCVPYRSPLSQLPIAVSDIPIVLNTTMSSNKDHRFIQTFKLLDASRRRPIETLLTPSRQNKNRLLHFKISTTKRNRTVLTLKITLKMHSLVLNTTNICLQYFRL